MAEALRAVRSSLGSDALILETKSRSTESGGGVEITALAEEAGLEESGREERESASRQQPQANPMDEIRQELLALKSMLGWLAPGLNHQDKVIKALATHGLAPEIVIQLSEAIKCSAGDSDREQWHRAISGMIPSGGQIRIERDRVALIGPAGVGKTSTLIKLTVFETQRRECRVGWINADGRHLAAGDSLAVYASILNARYEKAGNKKELKQALDHLSDCDLILIDTPGVNPRDAEAVQNLAKMFSGLANLRRTLLLNAATHGRDMAEWMTMYGKVGVNSLLFTKLDECRYFGPLINTVLRSGVPVSYITLGQNFAGDLEIAKPEVFASLLLMGVELHD
jgi:flagellar biosynthesis protein FlhF